MNHICKDCARIRFKEHPKSVLGKKRGHYFITCSICDSCDYYFYRLDLINMRLSRINKHHSAYLNWGIPRIFCPYFEEQHYSTIDINDYHYRNHTQYIRDRKQVFQYVNDCWIKYDGNAFLSLCCRDIDLEIPFDVIGYIWYYPWSSCKKEIIVFFCICEN
jgi:hypothetical protein